MRRYILRHARGRKGTFDICAIGHTFLFDGYGIPFPVFCQITSDPAAFRHLSFHKTEIQKSNRIHKVIAKVNQRLKEIGEALDLPLTLTTYVARHSQATVMKKAGVSTAVIREIMGHSSERVTQIYLDSFDNKQIDEAMKNLL